MPEFEVIDNIEMPEMVRPGKKRRYPDLEVGQGFTLSVEGMTPAQVVAQRSSLYSSYRFRGQKITCVLRGDTIYLKRVE